MIAGKGRRRQCDSSTPSLTLTFQAQAPESRWAACAGRGSRAAGPRMASEKRPSRCRGRVHRRCAAAAAASVCARARSLYGICDVAKVKPIKLIPVALASGGPPLARALPGSACGNATPPAASAPTSPSPCHMPHASFCIVSAVLWPLRAGGREKRVTRACRPAGLPACHAGV